MQENPALLARQNAKLVVKYVAAMASLKCAAITKRLVSVNMTAYKRVLGSQRSATHSFCRPMPVAPRAKGENPARTDDLLLLVLGSGELYASVGDVVKKGRII